MTLLHVASGRLFGGIEQMLVTLARSRTITPRVEPAFAVAAPGRLMEELRASGVSVTGLGDVRLSRPITVVRARRTIRQLMLRIRPDALICHAPWAFAMFAPVGRAERVPVVWWQHDHASGRGLVEWWAQSTPANLVISNSGWTAQSAHAMQPAAPVRVVPCPVLLESSGSLSRAEARRQLETPSDAVVVLIASRLEPWKGHLNLLRALAALRELPDWTLWIAGCAERAHERRYAAQLEREVAQSGLTSRVRFLGFRRDVPALLTAADVLCQPNDGAEPFGIALAEALLAGVPVITSHLGGATEIVDATCGRLVAPSDTDALAAALRELITDAPLRQQLGAAGRRRATERYTPERVLPMLEQVFQNLGDRTGN